MNIETSRLILRQWCDADLEPHARLNQDPAVMKFLPRPLTREESDAAVAGRREHIEKHGWGLWAVEVKGGAGVPAVPFIGCVGLGRANFEAPFTPCVEVMWRLAREHWGHGYASEAASESLQVAFEKLTLQQVFSFTVPLNQRSRRVMERIGMRRDESGDFEHPRLPVGDRLRQHVLYRASRSEWLNRR